MIDAKQIQERLEGLKKLLEAKRAQERKLQAEILQLEGALGDCGFWLEKARAAQAQPVKPDPKRKK